MTMNSNHVVGRRWGTAFLIVCIAITLGGVGLLGRTVIFRCRSTVAQAQVIEIETKIENSRVGVYRPVFSFVSSQGNMVVHSDYGWSQCPYKVGDIIKIRYDTKTPSYAKIDSFGAMWADGFVVTGFGLLLTLFTLGWLYLWRRATNQKS